MWLQCSSARSQHACPAAHTTDASSRGCLRGRYADSVLKGYATAVSVMLTGVLSMFLFGTELGATYALGMVNVVVSITLYNAKGLDENMCK